MVRSCILNSIVKDIIEAFLYVNTVKELWDELKERFRECNGPYCTKFREKFLLLHKGA